MIELTPFEASMTQNPIKKLMSEIDELDARWRKEQPQIAGSANCYTAFCGYCSKEKTGCISVKRANPNGYSKKWETKVRAICPECFTRVTGYGTKLKAV